MQASGNRRRKFLQQIAAAGGLLVAQQAFGRELEKLALPDYSAETFERLRKEYLLAPEVAYLNHASIGTIPRVVHEARVRYLVLCETNPWLYMWSGEWEEPREEVRRKAAEFLGCDAGEIVFTHNTTEAFNLLAQGLPLGPGDEVLFSTLNHAGASVAWEHFSATKGYSVRRFPFPLKDVPRLTLDDVLNLHDEQISSRTRVLVLPHIDNMVGLRHPLRELAKLAHSRGVEIVAVDGAQSVGMIPVDMAGMGVDVYATSPHKWLQAPKGVGLLYLKKELQQSLRPMWVTWGQKRWKGTSRIFEDYGTRNFAEVLTLGDAIAFQQRINVKEREQRLRKLWKFALMKAEETPGALWRSPTQWELSASLFAVEIKGKKSTDIFSSLFDHHSMVYRAFNTPELNTARLSPNVFTTEEEIARFFELAPNA